MKLATLNQKETKFLNDCFGDIYSDEEMKEIIKEDCKIKTFLRELRKIEKKNGYEPNKADITNVISYYGEDRYETIEMYCGLYEEDLKEGAQAYFNTYY